MHLAWPEPPAWALSPGWEIRCEMYPSRCEICCCCSSGVFHQPDLPAGASMAKQRSIYLAMDLFSSSTLLFVSLVGMRMLNPHHRLHYTTSLQSVTGDCVKSAIKDWYWLIQLWCCSSVLTAQSSGRPCGQHHTPHSCFLITEALFPSCLPGTADWLESNLGMSLHPHLHVGFKQELSWLLKKICWDTVRKMPREAVAEISSPRA